VSIEGTDLHLDPGSTSPRTHNLRSFVILPGMQMDVRWLGWAGFELTVAGTTILIDPLADPSAVFAALGEEAKAIADPAVVPPSSPG